MWKLSMALLASLALQQQGSDAMLLVEEEAGQNVASFGPKNNMRMQSCESQIAAACGKQQTLQNNLLFGGVTNKMACLADRSTGISDVCFFKEMEQTLDSMEKSKDKKCHDELRSKCGKQIDQLKKALQDTSIIGTVKGAVDVVECVVNHAEDLWNKCKPFEGANGETCAERARVVCQTDDLHILGVGKSLACLAENFETLGTECVTEQVTMLVDAVEASSDNGGCHDELRKQCGKQIDKLKREIEGTSLVGILKGTVDVAECVAQNARSLWAKCKPFHQPEDNVDACSEKVAQMCPSIGDTVLGMTASLSCLSEKAEQLGMDCATSQIAAVMESIENLQDNKCHDEMRKKCGKQIDALKKDMDNMDLSKIIQDSGNLASCLVDNAADLWEKCKPFLPAHPVEPQIEDDDCSSRVSAICPPSENRVLGLGYSLGCLAQHSADLGLECIQQEMLQVIETAEATALEADDKSCHDELRKKCGKKIDELKKQIQQTSVIGIVRSAVDVVACVAENAEDLWNKCKPFEAEAEDGVDESIFIEEEFRIEPLSSQMGSPTPPSRKPTKKPTKRPTRRPTRKPTHVPTNKPTPIPTRYPGTPKPTPKGSATTKPTTKPTPRKIAEVMMQNFDDLDQFQVLSVEDQQVEGVVAQEVEFNMDACVRSAREHCIREVEAFNASPFDRSLMQDLNDCIERNAAAIETDCMVASRTTSIYMFPSMINNFMGAAEHPPCRHPNDLNSNLPVCGPHHGCTRGRKMRLVVGAVASIVLFFALVKLTLVCYRRVMATKTTKSTEHVGGAAYQPLKSDNAAPVAMGALV